MTDREQQIAKIKEMIETGDPEWITLAGSLMEGQGIELHELWVFQVEEFALFADEYGMIWASCGLDPVQTTFAYRFMANPKEEINAIWKQLFWGLNTHPNCRSMLLPVRRYPRLIYIDPKKAR